MKLMRELLEVFEKFNDENDTHELINLKSEICNVFERKMVLKIGTKNKTILLLKSAQNIIKKRKRQVKSQPKSNRLNQHRSSSSSLNNSSSDSEMNMKTYAKLIEESIGKILVNMKNHIHGNTYTNMSPTDFNVLMENLIDQSVPTCYIQCICGDRLRLFYNRNRFQLSNFIKHLRNNNTRSNLLIKNISQEISDKDGSSEMNVDERSSGNENNLSSIENVSNQQINYNNEVMNNTESINIKKS